MSADPEGDELQRRPAPAGAPPHAARHRVLRGARVILRPPRPTDSEELRRIHAAPEVAHWWGPPGAAFPFEDEPETTVWVIEHEEAVAGLIQAFEEPEPDARHAGIDLFLDPAMHRRGLGTDALHTLMRELVEVRGHHRLTIDPEVDNHPAIACYQGVGFRRIGVMRRCWRHPERGWRDGLLMEWVAA